MSGPNSLGDTILLLDDDGKTTVLEPLEDPDADLTPEERQLLLDYLERTRKLYRSGPTASEAPRPPQKARGDKIQIGDVDFEVMDFDLTDDDDDLPPQVPARRVGPRSPKGPGAANAAARPPIEPDEPRDD